MRMTFALAAVAGMTATAAAQIAITPGGVGSASTTNGMFQIASVPSTPTTALAFAGNSFFSATTNATANDNLYAYHWLWRVNNSAGSTQDTREFVMSNGSGGGANSFMSVSSGANLGLTAAAGQTFDNFNVNNGYTFLAVSNYSIINTGAGPQVVNTMTITNRDNGPLSLSLFNYFDGAILNGDANDTVTYDSGTGAFNWSDTGRTVQHIGYGANAYQASAWSSSTAGTVTVELSDTGRDDLNNTVVAGAGDRAAAFQWNLDFAAGETKTIYVGLAINTTAVPTPGALALFGFAGLAAARRRRA